MDRADHLVGDGRFHDAYVVLNPVTAEMALMSVDELHRFALLYAEPVEVALKHTGRSANLAFYSRNREINRDSSFSVLG